MKTVVKVLLAVTVLITFLLLSCKKESSQNVNKQKVRIYLTDNPVNFQAVNINILKVEVKVEVEVDSSGNHSSFAREFIISSTSVMVLILCLHKATLQKEKLKKYALHLVQEIQ